MSKKVLIISGIIVGLLVLALLTFLIVGGIGGGGRPQEAKLEFWGVFDEPDFYDDAIRDYERNNPSVKINYQKFNFEDYERQLIDAFAAGTGPDIWLMDNTWLAKHGDKIQALPQTIEGQEEPLMTFRDFQNQFVDVAVDDLTFNGQIYALPLYLDTLALYYNKDIFNTAGITGPPATWEQFNQIVSQLTSLDQNQNIARSAAAIGTARNVNRSTDILMLMMIQSGVQMTDSSRISATFAKSVQGKNVGEIALQYYTDFANPTSPLYTWSDRQDYSIDAFAQGKTATMVNYSHHIQTLRTRAPRLNFGLAPMPQPASAATAVNYAHYFAPTVSKQSKNSTEAWRFLVYLTSAPGATSFLNASGRPAARRDLIDLQKSDPDLGVFANQALSARSWYQVDNSAIEKIFAQMIEDVNLARASIKDALRAAESQVSLLMGRSRP